ncbi:sigma-54 interaction domain-containing protein [Sedimentibacter saalensis]|uniref:Transcriptional regulator with PAS, ATPase and Fis domain n=1 Tax=Sedimentibacter saalensis TaxID=130788 RepID=A0A562JED3_9FIRM|nr:sigma 54-interacting transcriptional regulator [Sedimentibacter saalensis]TWH81510.1 transcriptional regulator with PAS, ATPase and Fis domain [Sedimentibacter saalensis]
MMERKDVDLHEQIKNIADKNEWLIKLAGPILRELCLQFCSKNFVIMLTDSNSKVLCVDKSNDSEKVGILINLIKNRVYINKAENQLIELRVLNQNNDSADFEQVTYDYGNILNHVYTIKLNSEAKAFITLTLFKEEEGSVLNSFMPVICKSISNLSNMYRKNKELEIQNNFRGLLIDASSDGMLSVDMKGIITFINPAGMRILKIDKDVVGKHITEGVDFEPTILHVLKTQKGYVDKEFRLKSKRGVVHFVKTAIPLRDEKGEMVGVLDIFRSIREVTTMVNRMNGAQAKYSIFNIIGESIQIKEIKKLIKMAGSNESPVLIEGESGTGKDIIAQSIHNFSLRSDGPFVTVDCEALPRNLLESELFGYEEGSFSKKNTGGRPGKIELAYGGTLFLNNVGYMPLDLQSKLSNALNNKAVVRIGGFNEIPIDIRVVCASSINLEDMVAENNFREDLYKLINTLHIETPPLRERHEDIDLIANQTLNQYNLINGTNKELSEEARNLLHKWCWPGNVRELERAIEYAYCIAKDNIILPEHMQNKISKVNIKIKENPLMSIREAEAVAVVKALEHTGGNITQAAKILGIGRNTLYGKMKEYDL